MLTRKSFSFLYAFCVVFLVSTSQAVSQDVRTCNYNRYGGASTDVVMSWLGNRFNVNMAVGAVSIIYPNGSQYNLRGERRMARNFTTFVFSERTRDVSNQSASSRYSFRIYNDGRCEARLDPQGFMPLTADGTWR